MKDVNQVALLVNGTAYSGWKSVRIDAGIDRQARTFELEVTNGWPGKVETVSRIKQGDVAQVKIGEDLVLTGYVDATPIKYDGASYSIGIKGRSKTADLVDCSPVTKVPAGGAYADIDNGKTPPANTQNAATQWRGRKLEDIASDLAKPYGITVITEIDTGPKIKNFSIQIGETVFETIDRMMRLNHVMSTDNGKGDLVFIGIGKGGRCNTALELGKNILTGSATLDYKDVYSEYVCLGQMAGTDDAEDQDAETNSGASASVTSALINRRRVLVLQQSGQVDSGTCKARVEYERAHRAAKALETDYTVAGWREEDGTLWLPNKTVRVHDPLIGFDVDMLIAGVRWVLDSNGQRTEIKVGPPDGYRTRTSKKELKSWGDVKAGKSRE